jgi:hypothetical protein
MRTWFRIAVAPLVLTACGGSTEPTPTNRYAGEWAAVQANGAPLPYARAASDHRVDSLRLTVFSFDAATAGIAEYGVRGNVSANNVRFVNIDTSANQLRVFIPFGEPSPFEFIATLKGDSLIIGSYLGARWALVKKPRT